VDRNNAKASEKTSFGAAMSDASIDEYWFVCATALPPSWAGFFPVYGQQCAQGLAY